MAMNRKTILCALLALCGTAAWGQYQDYSRMGRTPAELLFLTDPLEIPLKEPSWFFGGAEKDTPAEQLAYAQGLEREGRREAAIDAYDDLVRNWHATPQALTAQLSIARLRSAAGETQLAYDEDIYLLAHYNGRFELTPILEDATAQADLLAQRELNRSLRLTSGNGLRQNYERIIHFAPRWRRVPDLLLSIANLYCEDEEYASAITVCDRLIVDWPAYSKMDDVVSLYCRACREQANLWANDVGRLAHLERLLAGARTFRPAHPDLDQFTQWEREIYLMRRERAYVAATFYDNPKAYSPEAALLAYQAFLRDYPDAPQAADVRARIAALAPAASGETPAEGAVQSRTAAQPQE